MKTKIVFCSLLALGLAAFGCGSKRAKVSSSTASEADAGPDAGSAAQQTAGLEPEANTGPTKYPTPPTQSPGDRKPYKYNVSVTKAYVLPLSSDGSCWDKCSKETKKNLANSMLNLTSINKPCDNFPMTAAAVSGQVGAIGGADALPDIYVHVDCGFDQQFETAKTSAKDQLAAQWRGASETLRIDKNDMCSISVWDADEDGNDEMIGSTIVQLAKRAQNGKALFFGPEENFGQVWWVEMALEQLEGNTDNSSSNNSGQQGSTSDEGTNVEPTKPGAAWYTVEIVKANLKTEKEDGQPWDGKIPFFGKGDKKAPDPFVQAFLNGQMSESPFMTTEAKPDVNYCEWRTSGKVEMKKGDRIHFYVFDKDMADHDLMGTCITDPVENIRLGQETTLRNCGQVDFLVVKISKK